MKTIEYKGLWWVPSKKDRKVAGILYHIPGEEIRLELIGTFNPEAANSILAIFNAQNEDVIHGQDSDGQDISLFESSCSISHKGKAEFATSIYKSRVIAVGMHLDSLDDSRFFKATVKIPELSYWLYPATVQQVHLDGDNGKSMYVKMDRQPNEEREVAKTQISGGYSVALCRNATYQSGEFSFKPTFEQYTSLTIERKNNASLKQFYEKAVGFDITVPADIKQIINYSVIADSILEIEFKGGYLRKARGAEDISGDYNTYENSDVLNSYGKQYSVKGNGSKISLVTWTDGDFTYCLGFKNGADSNDVIKLLEGIK